MIDKDLENDLLPAATSFVPAPPASAALMEAVEKMKPVRTRARLGGFLVVLLVALVGPAFTLLNYPLRRDLAALPLAWVCFGAVLWGGAFALSLGTALVPGRHDVLPSVGRASRVSMLAVAGLFLFAAFWTAHAPGVSVRPEDLGKTVIESGLPCGRYVLQVAAVVLVAGYLVVRRMLPLGGRRLGIALGAAGGALGGFVLHFHCPVATAGHVLLSHVGAVIVATAAGALILSALLDP